MKIRLLHTRGSRDGEEQIFDQEVVRLGRRPDNDVAFNPEIDSSASGYHCEVFQAVGQVHVRDVGSSNGTYVNEILIDCPTPLRSGDVLRLGDDGPELRVQVGEHLGGTARWTPDADASASGRLRAADRQPREANSRRKLDGWVRALFWVVFLGTIATIIATSMS